MMIIWLSTSENMTEYLDIRSIQDLQTYNVTNECTATGLQCKGCCEIVLCQPTGSRWIEKSLATCPNDQICQNGVCIKNCLINKNVSFICTTSGMFPDPFDCQEYHFCVPDGKDGKTLRHTNARCEDDSIDSYGYNPTTTFCSDTLLNRVCDDVPVPICHSFLQKGALPRNPSLYYVCLNHPEVEDQSVLYPYQMACPFGRNFSTCGCV